MSVIMKKSLPVTLSRKMGNGFTFPARNVDRRAGRERAATRGNLDDAARLALCKSAQNGIGGRE